MFITAYLIIGIIVVMVCLIEGIAKEREYLKIYYRRLRSWIITLICILAWPMTLAAYIRYKIN